MVDAQGLLVFSSADPHAEQIDLSDREHIRVHKEHAGDRLFISKPVFGRISRQWSIQFTRPVYSADGRYAGVIVASVSPSYFSKFRQQIDLDGVATSLIRTGGVIIAHSRRQDAKEWIGNSLKGYPFEAIPEVITGYYHGRSHIDGVDRIYAWYALPRHGLVAVVGQSVDAAFAQYSDQRRVYLVGATGISLLLAIVGYAALFAMNERAIAKEIHAESEARWKFALEGAGDGVWDWNLERKTVQLSKRSQEILGVNDEILPALSQTLYRLVHPEDVESVWQALRTHLDGTTPSYVIERRNAEGKGAAWILARGMVVKRSANGRPLRMVGTYKDISERKVIEQSMKHLAEHDALTGLPNRALFEDRFRQALLTAQRESTKLAILYFDLDRFKPVNDTYGHATGDLLLKEVASRVSASLRKSDTVARIGGDEFVVLLPSIAEEGDARTVAETILSCLNTPFEIRNHTFEIAGSFGIAVYPTDGTDEAALLQHADQAMYQAKKGSSRM